MPPVLRRPASREDPRERVPPRVALALRPELERAEIPARARLGTNAPPFSGEYREEQWGQQKGRLLPGQRVTLCALRMPWKYVGFIVNPGVSTGPGVVAFLRIVNTGVDGFTPDIAIASNQRPQAFTGFIIGARAELLVQNNTEDFIAGLRGSIWGMGHSG
jgi:hypothetical protein